MAVNSTALARTAPVATIAFWTALACCLSILFVNLRRLFVIRYGRQLKADAKVVVLFRCGFQVKIRNGNLAVVSGRQLIQHVSHDGVILHFDLVAILEDQHGLRLIWDGRFSRLSRFFFGFLLDSTIRPVTTRSWGIVVHKRPRRLSWATAIENRWAATVVVGGIFVRCVVGLLRLYWYCVRNINRTARREKRALLMAMSPLKKWRVRVPRDQWVDAATRLGEKLASGLNTVRTQ